MDARRRHEIYTETVENFVENVPRSQIFRVFPNRTADCTNMVRP